MTIPRAITALAVLALTLALGACGGVASGGKTDWRSEARCQPPGGGLKPEQVLPDPNKCPEAYEGRGSQQPGNPVVPPNDPGPSAPPVEPRSDPCDPPALNGFPCYPVDPRGNPGPYYPPAVP